MATITFTSTFSSELMDWLQEYAKEHGMTKRAVLETALKQYKDLQKRQALRDAFRHATEDKEYMAEMEALAEEEITQWTEDLNSHEA